MSSALLASGPKDGHRDSSGNNGPPPPVSATHSPSSEVVVGSEATGSQHHRHHSRSGYHEADVQASSQKQPNNRDGVAASPACASTAPSSSSPSPSPPPQPPSPSSTAPTTQHLCVLTVGVLIFHVLTSALQEHIFHLPGFSNVLLLSFGETLCTTVLVAVQLAWAWRWGATNTRSSVSANSTSDGRSSRSASSCTWATLRHIFRPSTVELHWYVRIALLMSCSLYLTNQTSLLLSYPLQVIFKSSKLLCMVVVRRWWVRKDNRKMTTTVTSTSEGETDSEEGTRSQRSSSPPQPGSRLKSKTAAVRDRGEMTTKMETTEERGRRTPKRPETQPRHNRRSSHPYGSPAFPHGPSSPYAAVPSTSKATGAPSSTSPFPSRSSRETAAATAEKEKEDSAAVVRGSDAKSERHREEPSWSTASSPTACGGDNGRLHSSSPHSPSSCPRTGGWWVLLRRRGSSCWAIAAMAAEKVLDSVVASLCSARHGRRFLSQRLHRLAGWLGRRRRAFSPRSLHESYCTRRGIVGLLRASLHHLRVFLQDGELQACTVIVLGLILFTYASQVGETVSVAEVEYVRFNETGPFAAQGKAGQAAGQLGTNSTLPLLQQQEQQLFPTLTGAAKASTSTLSAAWRSVADLYTLWLSTLIGVSGVLLSNLIDAVIYVLEEVHCFQTAGHAAPSSPSPTREEGKSVHDSAAQLSPQSPVFQASSAPSSPVSAARGSPQDARTADVLSPVSAVSPQQTEVLEIAAKPSPRIPATSQEVLLMLNGIASLLYGGSLGLPWLSRHFLTSSMTASSPTTTSTAASAAASTTFPLTTFTVLIGLASVTSLVGTLCLLAIVAEYTGVTAVVVTNMRKTLTILLSFVLYGRRFTATHAIGLAGVMGGVVWNELLRRQRAGVTT